MLLSLQLFIQFLASVQTSEAYFIMRNTYKKKNKTKQNNQSQQLKQNLSEFGSNKDFPRRNEHLTWKMKD